MKKIKNYDNVFKQTILKLHENGKSLKELSREYGVSIQSISTWKRNSKKIGLEKGKDIAYEELLELRKKVKNLERDNDILKKGLAIFAQLQEKE